MRHGSIERRTSQMSDRSNVIETAKTIINRIQNDPAFREQVEKDPTGTLTGLGLPQDSVEDVMREGYDVAGFSEPACLEGGEEAGSCSYTCSYTCGTVSCAYTCHHTSTD